MKWTIQNCSTTSCSFYINLDGIVDTQHTELYIPSGFLSLGLYAFTLTVEMVNRSSASSSVSAYARIYPSPITVNILPLGAGSIELGIEQDLLLAPGRYSIDPDNDMFDDSVHFDRFIVAKTPSIFIVSLVLTAMALLLLLSYRRTG